MRHATQRGGVRGPMSGLGARLMAVMEGVAFWTAATFPFAHVGALLLYARGALSETVVVGLLAVHVAAIVAGHRHNRAGGRDE